MVTQGRSEVCRGNAAARFGVARPGQGRVDRGRGEVWRGPASPGQGDAILRVGKVWPRDARRWHPTARHRGKGIAWPCFVSRWPGFVGHGPGKVMLGRDVRWRSLAPRRRREVRRWRRKAMFGLALAECSMAPALWCAASAMQDCARSCEGSGSQRDVRRWRCTHSWRNGKVVCRTSWRGRGVVLFGDGKVPSSHGQLWHCAALGSSGEVSRGAASPRQSNPALCPGEVSRGYASAQSFSLE
jgi:hypothetical protein